MAEAVILLHGLARSRFSMNRIARALHSRGYLVVNVGYRSMRKSIETLAIECVPPAIARCRKQGAEHIHFVAYSMGGVVLRSFFHQQPDAVPELGRIVMLGTPNHGSEVIDRIRHWPLLPTVLGPAALQLGTDAGSVPCSLGAFPDIAHEGVGIIAGNQPYEPLVSSMVPQPSDGRVSVRSAALEGMREMVEVPYSHPFLLIRQQAVELAVSFIENGHFDPTFRIRDRRVSSSSRDSVQAD